MHHGGGPPNVQRNIQRSKSVACSEAEDRQQQQPIAVTQQQTAPANHPQSPVTTFAPAASPSAPQSPNYQIIMSRSPVTGQNMNITLQNVGSMVPGNQQITLTPLPLQSPASPSFQHQAPQWRFEHGSSSYIQVTSPLPQPIQPQSPTQHSPVPLQAVSRPGAPGSALGVCGQSPTRFVEAGIMVRQINLASPPGTGHFVYQENTGLAQLTPTTAGAVQLASPGTPAAVRERRLSQPHSQTGGTIHHHGPQSPVATGTSLPTLASPGHITTSNLPPQISSIIQGHIRPMIFEKTTQGVVAGVATSATATFGVPSAVPPSSPSRSSSSQGLSNPPITPTGVCLVKKLQPKKLEEIAPANAEVARLRKQCLEHHEKKMEGLKDIFKEYLIELFFLQHLQGNMMDYIAFKKKPCVPLFTYLRQNDLDLDDDEEEEEQSEVINDEVESFDQNVLHELMDIGSVDYFNSETSQPAQRLLSNSLSTTVMSPSPLTSPSSLPSPHTSVPVRTPSTGPSLSPAAQSKLAAPSSSTGLKLSGLSQGSANQNAQESSQDKQAEQAKLVRSESQVHQRIAELRKEGQWSASRLPKLQEASRPKSHWDYLLEEMQWMAADFAQERRWKMAAAKKLVRTCARYHDEVRKTAEREKNEEELRLRSIASAIAREVDYFWSNIQQVVEIKLRFEISDKRQKTLSLRKLGNKGNILILAYILNISPLHSPHEAVLIDSLLSDEQYRGSERTSSSSGSDGKPLKDIAEVSRATDLILPKGSARATPNVSTNTRLPVPSLLHGSLRDYQLVGVEWLANLHRKHLNGILADETGLGKTVQTVAYLAHLACHEGVWGPHLVVVRTCKLLNWEMEFKRWCPGLKILLYLGGKRERRYKRKWWCEPNSFHVCVTSYKLLVKDQAHFLKKRWKHMVLDEVQLIKNMTEKHWETIFSIKSQQRILLINNPLQNTLRELWTMIHFLLPGITRPFLDFPVKPGTDQNQDYCHKLVIRLHRMIQPFILRRSKRDVEKQLPKKYEHILKCRLSARQKSMYEDILTQPSAQEALKTGHFVSVLQVLMQLQRICNHPDLIQTRDTASSYTCLPLQYNTPSLLLTALQQDQWKTVDLSLFDLINNERKLTRYDTKELLPKLKLTQKLIEEIHSAPDPPARPKPCKIKPMRLFQSVQYGTKPEGRLVPLTSSSQTQHSASTTTTSNQPRGKPTVSTTTSTQGKTCHTFVCTPCSGDVVKVAQLASITGAQNRIAQPETPVTLQFQGNKFTLSPSQLRQLTTGQPLQLQGNILQIVSAPGQPILRQPGPMMMQTVPQAVPVQNSIGPQGPTPIAASTQSQELYVSFQESSEERNRQLKERLARLFNVNERRVNRSVLYGMDLVEACSMTEGNTAPFLAPKNSCWSWGGRDICLKAQQNNVSVVEPLRLALLSHRERLVSCLLPAAVAPTPQLYAANPPPSYSLKQKSFVRQLKDASTPYSVEIRSLARTHLFDLPDKRMLEMDSGKLEALSILLHKLKAEKKRVLIFTQMASMLDILESFLDHRHLTYVRVDENLSLEERRDQVKRFNRNKQFFCSILTNRCCSAVGHVFDADTIIFYDTDLNPSMDSRTQEWCDKIGRSKDIHIYRLESGNSIEEKLLKNGTKDLIREVAAQGTDYTLAFLTQRTIQDLFEVEAGSGEKVEEFVVLHQDPSPAESIPPHVARPYIQALNAITLQTLHTEDEQHQEGIEVKAQEDLMEDREEKVDDEGEGVEEVSQLEELTLTPIERYALHYLEYLHISEDDAVERTEAAKKGWELQLQQKLKLEGEERMILEEEEDLFTYTREDAYNMNDDGQTEIMPLWTPPTPPQDDNDIYIDSVICLMYDSTPMPESKLPPVYVRKEHKRLKMDPSAVGRKKKKGHGEAVIPPRSLFDKASMLKVRREGKDQKKNFSLKQQAPFAKPLPSLVKPAMEAGQDNPEWLISEDWALLQAVKQLLELPLNLTIVSPAHTPNWDLVSDVVSSCSRIYRSPKQCRSRYENVIIPREEGKLIYEANPKKKTKSIYKNSRPLRTCQIYTQDDNATQIQLYNNRFELMKIIASKRSPPIKPLLGMNPFQKNPKHASVLAESGISYDKPLPPIQVASQRAERIAKEKKALAEQQRAQQLAQQQQQAAGAAQTPGAAAQPQAQPQAAAAGPQAAGVPQTNQQGAAAAAGTATAQVVHTQQRAIPAATGPAEVVAIATSQGIRAVTPVTASAVVSTTLPQVQSQTRTLAELIKMKQKLQMAQQQQVAAAVAAAQGQQTTVTQQPQQVQAAPTAQASPQLTAVAAAPRAGAVLTGPVANLQVTRLTRVQATGALPAQAGQTAQVTLTKPPPVVSVPAVVSSTGVTTLPVTVAGISVAIGQAQKAGTEPMSTRRKKKSCCTLIWGKGKSEVLIL
uniref:E1A binding protein p400 n=1 Tax=Astyanax mexicanus TaxID=7994 RepID=A0A8B9JJ84_ASTMX